MRRIALRSVIACQLLLVLAAAQVVGAAGLKVPLAYPVVAGVDAAAAHYSVFDAGADEWLESDAARAYGSTEEYLEDVSRRGLLNSLDRLRMRLSASDTLDQDCNGRLLRTALLDTLGGVMSRVSEPESLPLTTVSESFGADSRSQGDVSYDGIFFAGTGSQIVLRSTKASGAVGRILVFDGGEVSHYASINQAIEVRTVCHIVRSMFKEVLKPVYERVTARLTSAGRGWTNYLEGGYSQYPWESFLNSAVTPRIFGEYSWYEPPREQLVLLHPELCVLIDIRTRKEASAGSALLVHGLGYIHYFGEERGWFLGLSASASLSDEDSSLAFGPTLHFDHVALGPQMPHISLSALWKDDGSDRPSIAVAVDFWRLLNGGGAEELFRSNLMGSSAE